MIEFIDDVKYNKMEKEVEEDLKQHDKRKIPPQKCPYCARHGERVELRRILPSSMITFKAQGPWSEGGYCCSCCGLQLPKKVFDELVKFIPMTRTDRCV